MTDESTFEVVIIGGSYAGLSAAMALGRSIRKVLVIDSGKPCNAPTPHSHNFLTQDGIPPSGISALARQQVTAYPTISMMADVVVRGEKSNDGFKLRLQSGQSVNAAKLVFATGIKDKLPDIPGFAECWGISVIHCPYCHGYEYRGRKTALLANGEVAMHYALLVGNLTRDLVILTNGAPQFTEDQLSKLRQHNITIISNAVASLGHNGGYMRNVNFQDGSQIACDALYFRPPFDQHSHIPEQLGCLLTEQGHLQVDAFQKTTVDGVYACGDNASPMRSVANAVAAGNMAGASINKELAFEKF